MDNGCAHCGLQRTVTWRAVTVKLASI
jgi:hypothetical protein